MLPIGELDEAESKLIKRPPFLIPFILMNRVIVKQLGRQKLENRLLGANIKLMPEEFILFKEIFIILSLAIFYFILKDILGKVDILWLMVVAGLTYLIPDLWLNMRLKARQREIIKALPDVIDLLSLCVNAGLDFSLAVKWVVDKSKSNPLIEELKLFLWETKMGKSRRQAFEDMAKRVNLPEIQSFTRTLILADRLGTSMDSALSILSEDARDYRFRRAERLALQAPIKMLIPLIFFILPTVLVIVGGPILLEFLQGGIPTMR
ncbi:MAG: type II secretion system F family protein [Candidatus Omnitrophica bacterium]|nr:type II secretion system F family protein [Candidatus Omnitrophota bacterium]